jgi:hypothetical protein
MKDINVKKKNEPTNALWYLGIQSLPSEEQACVLSARLEACLREDNMALLVFRYLQMSEAEATTHGYAAFSGIFAFAFIAVVVSEMNFLLDNKSALIFLLLLNSIFISIFLPSYGNYRLYSRGVNSAENYIRSKIKNEEDFSQLQNLSYAASSFASVKKLLEKHCMWSEPSTALLPKRFREPINSKNVQ